MQRAVLVALLCLLAGTASTDILAQTTPQQNSGGEHDLQRSDRGHHRSFQNAEHWAKQFDDPARDAWQKPDQVLDALQLQPGSRVADLGAGTGYFTVRIATRIPDGKLFAVDVEADMVRYLRERAELEHLHVIVPVLASAASPNLPEPVDLVLVVDTYHHIDNRVAYFQALRRSFRTDGRLAIVDFKLDSPQGPPPQHRVPPEKAIAELTAAGYSLVERHDFLPWQYFLIFQASSS
jgi:cyclopropane fatty-acyl-phospholipid synthase-like methyltransferase